MKIFKFSTHNELGVNLGKEGDVSLQDLENAVFNSSDAFKLKDIIRNYWKHFSMEDVIWFMKIAWLEVIVSCFNRTWKKLYPQ